jgi:hypothetical protein
MHSSLGWVDCTADKIGAACLIGLAVGLGSLPASAQLKPEARHAFEHFQELPPHRALAIEPNGNAHFWAGSSGEDPSIAIGQAMKLCHAKAEDGCTLFAVNNVVLNGRDWKAAAPPILPDIGRLRPEPYWQNKGPRAAAGLIVWSHGYLPGKDNTHSAPQGEVANFTKAGYDLYRFDREWIHDWMGEAKTLADAVRQAKTMGYRRVILAGQSHGAWASLLAVELGAPADGVIAISPARHGEVKHMRDVSLARSDWQQLVRGIKRGPRVVVVIFKDDAYDVGGRTGDASVAFAASGVDSIVIAYPAGFSGHDAANNLAFPRKFGGCLHDFIETGMRRPPCS